VVARAFTVPTIPLPNAELFGTILAVRRFNRFPLATAGNRLQDAV